MTQIKQESPHDLALRITSINSLLDGVVTYAYDNAKQVTQATCGMPRPNPPNKRVTGAIENSAGNITSQVFAYDSNGNNTSLTIGSNDYQDCCDLVALIEMLSPR